MFEVCNINKNEDAKQYYKGIESILYYAFNNGKRRYKLYSCNAEIREYNGILVLVSYATPIAVYTYYGSLYDCLRVVYGYTATSSQLLPKPQKSLAETNYPVQQFVRSTDCAAVWHNTKTNTKRGTRQCRNMKFGITKIWDIACVSAIVISGNNVLSIIPLYPCLCDIV